MQRSSPGRRCGARSLSFLSSLRSFEVRATLLANAPLNDDAVRHVSTCVEARFRRISVTEPFVLMISVIPLARWGRGGEQSGSDRWNDPPPVTNLVASPNSGGQGERRCVNARRQSNGGFMSDEINH